NRICFQRSGEAVVNGLRRDDDVTGLPEVRKGGRVKMISVGMRYQDQVRLRKIPRAVGWIIINYLSIPTQGEAGVVHRMNDNIAIAGHEVIASEEIGPLQLKRPVIP